VFLKCPIIVFTVTLRDPIDGPPPSADLAQAIRAALGTSMCTGTFIDTRFFVYSRRASSGRVWNPLPIYGNGLLLTQKSDYLRTLLRVEGFAESTPGDIRDAFSRGLDSFTDTYDYESDSDLDDVDDDADDWDSSAQGTMLYTF
jgi:tripeptidyl-peptidase-1